MNRKKIFALLLSLLLLFSLSGCEYFSEAISFLMDKPEEEPVVDPVEPSELVEPEPIDDPNWPVTVAGLEINEAPEKVAVISPALAEYLYDMKLLEKTSALCDFCEFGDEAKNYPSVGSVNLPDWQTISDLSPRYILTVSPFAESALIKLQQQDCTVVLFAVPKTFEELENLYRELALFFLGAEDGKTYGETYVESYRAAKAALPYSGEKVSVAFLRAMDRIMLTGEGMAGELIAGCFENVAQSCTGYEYPADDWKAFNPTVLFVGGSLHLADLETSDLYKKKSAVKEDKVFAADLDALSLGSLRSFRILRDMMATVYEDYPDGTALSPAYPSIYS